MQKFIKVSESTYVKLDESSLEKAKNMPIGATATWADGKTYKKVSENKWEPVDGGREPSTAGHHQHRGGGGDEPARHGANVLADKFREFIESMDKEERQIYRGGKFDYGKRAYFANDGKHSLKFEGGKVVRSMQKAVELEADDEFDEHQLAIGIQVELEHTEDIEEAMAIAMQHLKETPDYYTRLVESGLVDEEISSTGEIQEVLEKARITKYIKRIPKPSGKGYYYFYNRKQLKDYYENGIAPGDQPKEEKGIIAAVLSFFGVKSEGEAKKKIAEKFEEHKDKFKGMDKKSFEDHVIEYLTNKEKWDKRISGQNGEAKGGEKKADKKPAEKKGDKPEGAAGKKFNLSVMRQIAGIFGAPGRKDSKSEDNLETMPEVKTIDKKDYPDEFDSSVVAVAPIIIKKEDIKDGFEIFGHKFFVAKNKAGEWAAFHPESATFVGKGETVEEAREKTLIKLNQVGKEKIDELIAEATKRIELSRSIAKGDKKDIAGLPQKEEKPAEEKKSETAADGRRDPKSILGEALDFDLKSAKKFYDEMIKQALEDDNSYRGPERGEISKEHHEHYDRILKKRKEDTINYINKLTERIKNKDRDLIETLHTGNKNSRNIFEEMTGVSLGSTAKSTEEALSKWLNIDIKAERDAAEKERKAKEDEDKKAQDAAKYAPLGSFGDNLSPKDKGRALEMLSKQYRLDGADGTMFYHIKKLVGDGWTIKTNLNGDKWFRSQDGVTYQFINKSKIIMNYIEHVIKEKNEESSRMKKNNNSSDKSLQKEYNSIHKEINIVENFLHDVGAKISGDLIIEDGEKMSIEEFIVESPHVFTPEEESAFRNYTKNSKRLAELKDDDALVGGKLFKSRVQLEMALEKAKPTKYIKRIPKPGGKGWIYFYNEKQIKDFKEKGIVPEDKPKGEKKDEPKKGFTDEQKHSIKDALKKVVSVLADALSAKDPVAPAAGAVEETGERIREKGLNDKKKREAAEMQKQAKKKAEKGDK
jgi:hypothetical protein